VFRNVSDGKGGGMGELAGLISFVLFIATFYKMFSLGEKLGVRDDAPLGRKNNKKESFFFFLWFSFSVVVAFVVGYGSLFILK
jgi:hypothetical protein